MPRPSAFSITARVLLVPYAIAVALIVWLPAATASRVTGLAFRVAKFFAEHTGVSLTTSYTIFEFLANIALFVPFGILLTAGWPRTNTWWIILLGFSASATIELVQTMIPGRVTTLSDVVANTLGTIIGCLLVRIFLPLRTARRQTVYAQV